MRLLTIVGLLAVSLSPVIHALRSVSMTPPFASQFRSHVATSPVTTNGGDGIPPAHFYRHQTLDHFNAHNQGTYSQRYFINDTFWKPYNGPVFVMIGGEGSESPYDALYGHHMEMAEQYGALVFVVEHRYYGNSVPTQNLSTENLQWLSSQQALADLAVFLESMAAKYNIDLGDEGRNKVIAFGGSYPGALAAWFRIKYPHLVYGSVASSAPVMAQLDFTGYNEVVSQSMAAPIVGGSEACAQNIFEAFKSLDDILNANTTAGVNKVSHMFKSCKKIRSKLDQINFVGSIAGNFQGTVQYNGQGGVTIADLCNVMLNKSEGATPLDRLAAINNMYLGEQNCTDYSWSSMLKQFENVNVDPDSAFVGYRQWTYQTCTQFGYYQTCEPWKGTCLFSPRMSLESNVVLCKDLFDFSTKGVESRILFSNDYYGGNQPDASRIVFVNGDIDPWHALSVLESNDAQDITSILIHGGSHCQNMGPTSNSDSAFMQQAKAQIQSIVGRWVQ